MDKQCASHPQNDLGDTRPKFWARFSLYGDLPTQLLIGLIKVVPRFLEPLLIYPLTFVVVALATQQRRSIGRNLQAIPNRKGRSRFLIVDIYKVFLHFGQSYVEGLRVKHGQLELQWNVQGQQHLDSIRTGTQSCLILTGHTANYDIAATLFADKIGRVFNIVRAAERNEKLDEIRREQLTEIENSSPLLKIHYNTSDMSLGVELARALERGEVVAVQADRVAGKVSSTTVEVPGGARMPIPRGPLMLAAIGSTEAFPLFVVRTGSGAYDILAYPPLEPQKIGGITDPWVTCLFGFLSEHWSQWFMFEDAFETKGA